MIRTARHAPSLRVRLLLILLVTGVSILGVTLTLSYQDARHELDEIFDAQLAGSARMLLAQATHELNEAGGEASDLEAELQHHPYERHVAFQIWSEEGELLFRSSPSTPQEPLSLLDQGFSSRELNGEPWRIFARWDRHHRLQIQLGQKEHVRQELAAAVTRHVWLPLMVGLPLLGLFTWLGLGVGLRPLDRLSREITRRSPDRLEPLVPGPLPPELTPVVEALNGLLTRLQRALSAERQFTSDAAHELRTPLAGLKMQAQLAQRADTAEVSGRALEGVLSAVERMTHLVSQLLTLARLDPDATDRPTASCSLSSVAEAVVAELAPAAFDRGLELSLEGDAEGRVQGDEALLRVLLRNLVDNAIRYSPPEGRIQVEILEQPERVGWRVCDQGPGIPPAERERVLDRFYRVPGTGEDGSGLGLAIVRRVVELHGAVLRLADADGPQGLKVEVWLPRARTAGPARDPHVSG